MVTPWRRQWRPRSHWPSGGPQSAASCPPISPRTWLLLTVKNGTREFDSRDLVSNKRGMTAKKSTTEVPRPTSHNISRPILQRNCRTFAQMYFSHTPCISLVQLQLPDGFLRTEERTIAFRLFYAALFLPAITRRVV